MTQNGNANCRRAERVRGKCATDSISGDSDQSGRLWIVGDDDGLMAGHPSSGSRCEG